MKIIQVPFNFYPDPPGGTEIYVHALARHLVERGVDVVIAAPGAQKSAYDHEGLLVRRFPVSEHPDLRILYGAGDPVAARGFAEILEQEKPDLVHLHAHVPATSCLLIAEISKRAIPLVFTYHTPTASCQRGTLLRWGTEICDGKLRVGLCARCSLQGLGIPRPGADWVGGIPTAAGRFLQRLHLRGGVWTALQMRSLIALRHNAFRQLADEADHVVAVCQWGKDLLIANGFPTSKISFSRQGLAHRESGAPGRTMQKSSAADHLPSPFRIAFVGRLAPEKGLHLLLEALRQGSDLQITLDIYGIAQDAAASPYIQNIQKLAVKDSRVAFLPAAAPDQVVNILSRYDLLAVPSQGLETGPMVILEAFAAGVPVLGSRLGGIAELVSDGINGLLVDPTSGQAWHQALRRISGDRELLHRLRSGVTPPRGMESVAGEMADLYQRILRNE